MSENKAVFKITTEDIDDMKNEENNFLYFILQRNKCVLSRQTLPPEEGQKGESNCLYEKVQVSGLIFPLNSAPPLRQGSELTLVFKTESFEGNF